MWRFQFLQLRNRSSRTMDAPNWGRLGLLLLLTLSGCAAPKHANVAEGRAFQFQRDTFSFPNELVWDYQYDAEGKWTTKTRHPRPEYTQHCFVLARSTLQFFQNARFETNQPIADEGAYRRAIRRVISSNPRHSLPEAEKIAIPGYPDLRSFSRGEEKLLKSECGGRWRSYFQRGHWRMIFPFSRGHQERTARQLLSHVQGGGPVVVHLVRFPQLTINHAVVLFGAMETDTEMKFDVYDPNRPERPVSLTYDRATRTFFFLPNDYFPGGRVDVYQVYHRWNY